MSKEFKNIDNLFRSELGGSETPASPHVKTNIDKALGFNKRRSGFIRFGLVSLALISTATFFYTTNSHVVQSSAKQATIYLPNNFVYNGLNEQNSAAQEAPTEGTLTDNNSLDTAAAYAVFVSSSSLFAINTGLTTTTTSANRTKKNDLLTKKTDPNKGAFLTDPATKEDTDILTTQAPKNINTRISSDSSSTEVAEIENTITSTEILTDKVDLAAETDSITEAAPPLTKIKETDSSENPTPLAEFTEPLVNSFKPWMLHVTGGPNIVRSAYTAAIQNEKTTYDNAMQDRTGSQLNLDFMYGFRKGLSIGSGIGVTNFKENYLFQTKIFTLDSIKNIDFEYDSSGVLMDSSIYYTYEEIMSSFNHEGITAASYVHLPIHIGAQLIFGKLQVDVYSSIRFNFRSRSSGGYIAANQFIGFEKGNSIFKPFYVDLILGTRVNYRLFKSLYASMNLQYRPVLGAMYTTASFNKSFDYMHLGLGLSYRF